MCYIVIVALTPASRISSSSANEVSARLSDFTSMRAFCSQSAPHGPLSETACLPRGREE